MGWVIIIALYFVPTIIALARHHHNALAISMLNTLAGWTLVGWIAAFVWSCTIVKRTGIVDGHVVELAPPPETFQAGRDF